MAWYKKGYETLSCQIRCTVEYLSYLPLLFPGMRNPTLVYIEKIEETRGTFHGVAL